MIRMTGIIKSVVVVLVIPGLLGSCAAPPEEVAQVSDEIYVVSAVKTRSLLSSSALIIKGRESTNRTGSSRRLIEVPGLTGPAKLKLSPKHILWATVVDSSGALEICFLLNLSSPPCTDFYLLDGRPWADDTVYWHYNFGEHLMTLARLEPLIQEHRISTHSPYASSDIYILGAAGITPAVTCSSTVALDIDWINGDTTQGLLLKLPEDGTGFIEVVYGGEDSLKADAVDEGE